MLGKLVDEARMMCVCRLRKFFCVQGKLYMFRGLKMRERERRIFERIERSEISFTLTDFSLINNVNVGKCG